MFSKNWKSSVKPTKQRKYVTNAPKHIKSKMMSVHLSEELSKKFGKRAVRVVKGDKVKVMKGQFKDKTGKVEEINLKNLKLYIAGLEIQKKDGTKVKYSIASANVMITELNLDDKKRQDMLKRK